MDKEELKLLVRTSFEDVPPPPDWALRESNEGDEPDLLEREFKGKKDWTLLEASFLDQAPDGYGSALSFFSDEAFRFYLPAYLIAVIDNRLNQHDPVYHLTHGLDAQSSSTRINPRRYANRTWFDHARCKFAMFTPTEVRAIIEYLKFKAAEDDLDRVSIQEALESFWISRAAEPDKGGGSE